MWQTTTTYDIVLFDYYDGLLCGFSSRLHEICIYCKADILERHRPELGHLDIGKGCIRFNKIDDLPLDALHATAPHCDIVFMSRGTEQLYTVWTPLDDIPYDLGGLMILENSHRQQEHLGEYWQFDVDTYCIDDHNDDAHERWAWGKGGGSYSKDAIGVRQQLGGRWLSTEYKAGDLLIFSMRTLHASLDNCTDRVRLSTDSRYQLAEDAVDERWIGANPIAHGPEAKIGLIC